MSAFVTKYPFITKSSLERVPWLKVGDSNCKRQFWKTKIKIKKLKKSFFNEILEKQICYAAHQIICTFKEYLFSKWPWPPWWTRPETQGHEVWLRSPTGVICVLEEIRYRLIHTSKHLNSFFFVTKVLSSLRCIYFRHVVFDIFQPSVINQVYDSK